MSSLWTTVVCPDGPYEMNTEGIARLIRSYAYARALKENSTVNVEKHLLGPNLVTVDIDWTQVPKSRDHFIAQTSNEFFMRMSTNMSGSQGMDYLETMVEDRDGYHAQVLDMQRDAGKQTMANIETSVERGDVAIKALTAVRDGAAETELVLASVALAPAAAGVIGGGLVSGTGVVAATEAVGAGATAATGVILGSAGKGGIKWQETGSIGQGLAEGYIELAINSLTLGLRNALPNKVDRIAVALVFGMVKGAIKMGPASMVSPEDVARGKKKSLADLLLPAIANVPAAAARDLVSSLTDDVKWALPATVVLKLMLKYGAKQAASSMNSAPRANSYGSRGPAPGQGFAMARAAMVTAPSSYLFDSARPSEEFVVESALRPLTSH